jgi:hypothetical protein
VVGKGKRNPGDGGEGLRESPLNDECLRELPILNIDKIYMFRLTYKVSSKSDKKGFHFFEEEIRS